MGLFDEFLLLLGARKVVKAFETGEQRMEQKLEEADEKWRTQVEKQLASNNAYEDLLKKQLDEKEEKMKQLMARVPDVQ